MSELQAAGYFIVFVDYLGRNSNCAHVSHAQVGEDILAAASWSRGQTGVDSGRIPVIAWSYGGGGVLAALRDMPPGPPMFTKASMYYPDCRVAEPWPAAGMMLMGAGDEVVRPALCDTVVKGAPPNRLRTILYPNALHAFDTRGLPERVEYPFGTIGYNADVAKAS